MKRKYGAFEIIGLGNVIKVVRLAKPVLVNLSEVNTNLYRSWQITKELRLYFETRKVQFNLFDALCFHISEIFQ